MNAVTWAKMPTDWVKLRRLKEYPMGAPGTSTPALKLYVYLAGTAGAPRPGLGASGTCCVTYSELVACCGVSRGAIGPALDCLDGLVDRTPGRGRQPNFYVIRDFPAAGAGGWARLPIGYLLHRGCLEQLGSRSRSDLAALKLYLILLTFANNKSGLSTIAYEKLSEYAGMTRNDVSRAGSLLIHLDMVTVDPGRYARPGELGSETTPNRYRVRGLSRLG